MGTGWDGDIRYLMQIRFSTQLGRTKTAVRTAETIRQQRTRYLENLIFQIDLIFLIKKLVKRV